MPFKRLLNKLFHSQPVQSETAEDKPVMGELGIEKLKSVIAEVSAAIPLFEKAGYEVEEIQVEIGMTPKLMPRFRVAREISVAEQQHMLEEAGERKLVKFILISLFKSTKMKNLIQDPKLEFHSIEIDLTAVPSVRGIFKTGKNTENVIRLNSHDLH